MTRARSFPETRGAYLALVAAAVAIALMRPGLAARYHRLKVTSDVYPFGSPEHVVVESLGYRAALADAIFAHVRVSYGIHFQEHRRFEFVGDYLDAVAALDPTFRDPFRYADTLLVLSPEEPRPVDYERARAFMLRGIELFPHDTELWLTTGQFLAYLASPHLHDANKAKEWRIEGAKLLARACELANANENVPYNCIVSAGLLEQAGEREAAIRSLQRLVDVTDDPDIQRLALGYLEKRLSERKKEESARRRDQFREAWKADLPSIPRDLLLVLGPRFDPARCAGQAPDLDTCATSWKAWRERIEHNQAAE